jgi:ribosomal protein L44E
MRLTNGKFYDGDKEVPLEFGNREQIELLKTAIAEAEKGHKVNVNTNEKVTYKLSMDWKCCKCFKLNVDDDWNEYEDWEPDFDDIQCFIEDNIECSHCGQEHKLVVDKTNRFSPQYYVQAETD